ncbi:MAG: hypothetical protein IBJ10_07755 [Phycisphaerales bacterium]|nr:hypothetical protein [Phycisphaerales bacterium]
MVVAFVDGLSRAEVGSDLIGAMGRWRSPEIERQLLAPAAQAYFQRNTDLLYRLLGGVAPEKGIRDERHGELIARWTAALGDRKVHPGDPMIRASDILRVEPDNEVARGFLLNELDQPVPSWAALDAIADSRDPRFIAPLTQTVRRLKADPDVAYESAVRAVEAIVRLGGDVPPDVVALFYEGGRQGSPRLNRALLQTLNVETLQRLTESVGAEEMARLLAIQALRPVPDDMPLYVPRSSHGWVWQWP